jgi:hypothetical protein
MASGDVVRAVIVFFLDAGRSGREVQEVGAVAFLEASNMTTPVTR